MSNTKNNLPAMPFYIGDWLKCPELRACSPSARALWMDMLCYMWESTERGNLTINNKPIPLESLARMTGFADNLLVVFLAELEMFAVFSRRPDGAIFSRKMVRDEEIRQIRAKSGQNGGFATAKHLAKSQQNTEYENESENESEKVVDVVFNQKDNFELAWSKYPIKDGKKAAERSFKASVHNEVDMKRLVAAMANYLKSEKVSKGFTKNGSTWFANWKDWETYLPPKNAEGKPPAEVIAVTCVAQGMKDSQIKTHMLEKGYTEHRIDESIMRARGMVV